MKLARIRVAGRPRYAVVEGDTATEVRGSPFRGNLEKTTIGHRLSEVTYLPVTAPVQLIGGVGVNYRDHVAQAEEKSGVKLGAMGIQPFFTSNASLTGHGSPIIITPEAGEVHYEGELVVVMGRKARHVSKENALEYVYGYTCGNDVSEKESWEGDFSLWRAKGLPGWSPVGPWIETDFDPSNVDITVRFNGRVEHTYNTRDIIHDIPTIISFLSQYTTLYPGDLIFTGTSGTTRAMKPGDIIQVEIPGIGTLSNPVVREPVVKEPLVRERE